MTDSGKKVEKQTCLKWSRNKFPVWLIACAIEFNVNCFTRPSLGDIQYQTNELHSASAHYACRFKNSRCKFASKIYFKAKHEKRRKRKNLNLHRNSFSHKNCVIGVPLKAHVYGCRRDCFTLKIFRYCILIAIYFDELRSQRTTNIKPILSQCLCCQNLSNKKNGHHEKLRKNLINNYFDQTDLRIMRKRWSRMWNDSPISMLNALKDLDWSQITYF